MLGLHGALRLRTDRRRRFDEARQHLALDDDGYRPQLIETIFVPRGAEERAVRRGLRRARSSIRVVAHGIGPLAAARAADIALGEGAFGTALSTGLCGLLSPAFLVGDALVYREFVRDGAPGLRVDAVLGDAIAAALPGSQSGICAFASERILLTSKEKYAAAARYNASAVDMESFALVERLSRAGVAVAVARIGSDGVEDDLPDLERALDGSGGVDAFALALAMLRAPARGVRLARSGMRALAKLEQAAYLLARAA